MHDFQMKNVLMLSAVLCACIWLQGISAHPGRLDKYGGHHELAGGKRTYHFHKGPLVGKKYPNRTAALAALKEHRRKQRKKEQDGSRAKRTIELRVKKVLQPDVVRLPNGRLVRLLGIFRPKDNKKRIKATERLRLMIEGKDVLFEFATPPEDKHGYYRGFFWIERNRQDGRKEKVMVNLLLARDGSCEVDMSSAEPYAKDFKSLLRLEASRPKIKIGRVYSPTSFRIEGHKIGRLAGLRQVTDIEIKPEAKAFLEKRIADREIGFEKCVPEKDTDGAYLLYLWLDNKTMLNLLMIEKGLAEPDELFHHRYSKEYAKALERHKKAVLEKNKR